MLMEIQELFAYDRWADHRLLEAASALAPADYTRHPGGFPSVHDVLFHLLSSKWIWLGRWLGNPAPRPLPAGWDTDLFDDLRRHWEELERQQDEFLRSLNESDLDRMLDFVAKNGKAYTLPLRQTLRHVANHSTYHRGQAATLLRQLGAQPPATDLFLFYVEQANAPETA